MTKIRHTFVSGERICRPACARVVLSSALRRRKARSHLRCSVQVTKIFYRKPRVVAAGFDQDGGFLHRDP